MAEPVQSKSSDQLIAELESMLAGGGSATTGAQVQPIGVPTTMRDPVTGQTVPFVATRRGDQKGVPRFSANIGGVTFGGGNRNFYDRQVEPSFFEGDEYMPSSWSREDIGRLQMALRNAGLVGPRSTFRLGVWDETSRGAYRKLLEYANGAGHTDPLEALRDYAASKAEDVVGDERAPLTVRLSNPMDLRRVADVAIPAVTGRKMDAAQLDKIIAAYQQKEREEQEGLYAADVTGGTVTQAPDFQSFAESEARRLDPQGAAEMDYISRGNQFFDLLSGVGDPAPTKGKVKDTGGMDPNFHAKLNALIAASGGRLSIRSGYRSTDRQAQLWNNALAKYGSAAAARKWVAPPGRSNHNRGLAADLAFRDEAARAWAHANAKKFGLHFPMGHEPWHVEPIGLADAKKGHTPAPQSANAAERHAADDGHDHGGQMPEDAQRFTVDYQMQSFAQLLMGGGDAPSEEVDSGV